MILAPADIVLRELPTAGADDSHAAAEDFHEIHISSIPLPFLPQNPYNLIHTPFDPENPILTFDSKDDITRPRAKKKGQERASDTMT